jgi:putative transcriptional regulator
MMDTQLFNELVGSIQEAGAIRRNEKVASRVFQVELPDVKSVREKTGLSQTEFANRLHISPRTLQNWEQKRRHPTGPAATLMRILNIQPDLIGVLD